MTWVSLTEAVAEARAYIARYARQRQLKKLALETGRSYDWLRSMHQGRITNPTVGNLEKVLDHKRRHQASHTA